MRRSPARRVLHIRRVRRARPPVRTVRGPRVLVVLVLAVALAMARKLTPLRGYVLVDRRTAPADAGPR